MNDTKPRRPAAPHVQKLRDEVLAALVDGSMSTDRLTILLKSQRCRVYRALLSLQDAGQVRHIVDHRVGVTGRPGAIWSRIHTDRIPPRDPLLWAMFGGRP